MIMTQLVRIFSFTYKKVRFLGEMNDMDMRVFSLKYNKYFNLLLSYKGVQDNKGFKVIQPLNAFLV